MKQNDAFAQIAASGISTEGKGLITPEPPVLEEIYFRADGVDEDALFTPLEKIHDKKEPYMKRWNGRRSIIARSLQTMHRSWRNCAPVSS